MYLIFSSVHFSNGARSLTLLLLHIIIIAFFRILYAAIVVWCFLVKFKYCITFKIVYVSVAYF